MQKKAEKKKLQILRALKMSGVPLSSAQIAETLHSQGVEISERTVRFHLLAMDKEGLTENLSKRGRLITPQGFNELANAKVIEKIGFLAAKIDKLTYRMDFNLAKRTGSVVINVSVIRQADLARSIPLIQRVFEKKLGVGELMQLFGPGERVGDSVIPDGMVGIGTVCSITVNGVLMAAGIPINSRFGGLLEIHDGKPFRFVELIHYEGTTIDPLEIFIRSAMTDYMGATRTGNGIIGASFREVPEGSREAVRKLGEDLEAAGLGAVSMVGWPGVPLLDIPVSEERMGMVVMGGMNPVAILPENQISIHRAGALSGLYKYEALFSYQELPQRSNPFI